VIIAHHADFDRRFLERRFPAFIDTPWACSAEQVPWSEEGRSSRSLGYLLNQFGFFYDGHRAMTDCRAVLHLLSLSLPRSGRAILPCCWRPPAGARSAYDQSRDGAPGAAEAPRVRPARPGTGGRTGCSGSRQDAVGRVPATAAAASPRADRGPAPPPTNRAPPQRRCLRPRKQTGLKVVIRPADHRRTGEPRRLQPPEMIAHCPSGQPTVLEKALTTAKGAVLESYKNGIEHGRLAGGAPITSGKRSRARRSP
jgi:hypothetical protein